MHAELCLLHLYLHLFMSSSIPQAQFCLNFTENVPVWQISFSGFLYLLLQICQKLNLHVEDVAATQILPGSSEAIGHGTFISNRNDYLTLILISLHAELSLLHLYLHLFMSSSKPSSHRGIGRSDVFEYQVLLCGQITGLKCVCMGNCSYKK